VYREICNVAMDTTSDLKSIRASSHEHYTISFKRIYGENVFIKKSKPLEVYHVSRTDKCYLYFAGKYSKISSVSVKFLNQQCVYSHLLEINLRSYVYSFFHISVPGNNFWMWPVGSRDRMGWYGLDRSGSE
jgi:hypothetical protein